ncbi:hypothetical protein L7F22_022369 [Adiantum nelumboides]|nr:hypothetical protein [Adiantum nelumboides]
MPLRHSTDARFSSRRSRSTGPLAVVAVAMATLVPRSGSMASATLPTASTTSLSAIFRQRLPMHAPPGLPVVPKPGRGPGHVGCKLGKSRGYGFIAFRDKADAEQSIATMNGEWLGSRAIRVNWANQKNPPGSVGGMPGMGGAGGGMANMGLLDAQQQPVFAPARSMAVAQALGGMGALGVGAGTSMPPTGGVASGTPITYEQAVNGSSPSNTTVYVGNIPPFATQNDLVPLFSQYGFVREVRMQSERGFRLHHARHARECGNAIVNLAGHIACEDPSSAVGARTETRAQC